MTRSRDFRFFRITSALLIAAVAACGRNEIAENDGDTTRGGHGE